MKNAAQHAFRAETATKANACRRLWIHTPLLLALSKIGSSGAGLGAWSSSLCSSNTAAGQPAFRRIQSRRTIQLTGLEFWLGSAFLHRPRQLVVGGSSARWCRPATL